MYFKHQKYTSFSLSEPNYFSQSAFGNPVQYTDPKLSCQFWVHNNENILEYAQIVVIHANSRILGIEGHPIIYGYCRKNK